MELQEVPLALGKPADIHGAAGIDTHALQRRQMRHRRDDEATAVLKANEAAIEQVVDAGRQEQAVFAVQTLVVRLVAPGLAGAGNQVDRVVDLRDPTSPLDLHHALLEQALSATGPDDRFAICVPD